MTDLPSPAGWTPSPEFRNVPVTASRSCATSSHVVIIVLKAGTLGSTIQSIMEELKPEAAYFADMEGGRGGYIVVNMDDASQVPAIAEPLFLGLGATIQVHPVMTLGKAAPAIEQAAKKYG
jgi:Domain of unknown function (DUF3303)